MPERSPSPETVYDPTFSTALHPDLGPDATTRAALRACIDLPAMIRVQGLRMIVFAGAVSFGQDETTRKAARQSWARAAEGYELASHALSPGVTGLHPAAKALLLQVLPDHLEASAVVPRFRSLATSLFDAIERSGVTSEYDLLMQFTYREYVPSLMSLENGLKQAVETRHLMRRSAADAARIHAQDARNRIWEIARMVRMISLNARVEAARAGEFGRAFGVIASEIRNLSERTENASVQMGTSIDEILENLAAE